MAWARTQGWFLEDLLWLQNGLQSKTIDLLDHIEGYDSALKTEDCPLLRRPVEASRFMDGQQERLQSYLLNQDPKELVRINHGCYRHNVVEKQIPGNWILAYGSTLSKARLEERIGKLDRVDQVGLR